jgi:regulatory protein
MTQGEAKPNLRARALRLLARREHSREELRRKLRVEDAEPGEIASLLDDLERRGWLSEQRVAEQLVRAAHGRYGSRQVLERLTQKGIDGETLAGAVQALKAQELDSARRVWRKRFGTAPTSLQEKAKQARFLSGRGFPAEVVALVLGGMDEDA